MNPRFTSSPEGSFKIIALKTDAGPPPDIAVVLLDVVMETDHSGLDLVWIILRIGQRELPPKSESSLSRLRRWPRSGPSSKPSFPIRRLTDGRFFTCLPPLISVPYDHDNDRYGAQP